MPASGQPCTPLAQIYSDSALTQALANPTSTDGLIGACSMAATRLAVLRSRLVLDFHPPRHGLRQVVGDESESGIRRRAAERAHREHDIG